MKAIRGKKTATGDRAQDNSEIGKTMTEPVWNKFLTERDKVVFAAAGYGVRAGFGKRPAPEVHAKCCQYRYGL